MAEPKLIYTGRIVHIGDVETYGDFQKAVVVVCDESSKYPQEVPFEVTGDMIEKLKNFSVGNQVEVAFNLRGRAGSGKWEGRWFGSVQAWRITGICAAEEPEASEDVVELEPADEAGFPF